MAKGEIEKRTGAGWGLPDWRVPASYPEHDDWDLDRWRWEFLRRSDDYRYAFKKAAEETQTKELRFRHDNAATYEISDFFAPWVSEWDCGGPMWHPLPMLCIDDDGHPIGQGAYVNIYFDISKPLGPQLAAAKEELEMEQGLLNLSPIEVAQLAYGVKYSGHPEIPMEEIEKKLAYRPRAPNVRPQNWPRYLRVLDARETGASWSEITQVFFENGWLDRRTAPGGGYAKPPPQAAQNLWMQAKALRF